MPITRRLVRFLIRHAARSKGFMDPIELMHRLETFAQPSEVAVPMELLRAGAVFHARGLLNTKAIQSNLDWYWPFWVRRQFDPHSDSFVPRAFSATHINLTCRNWTAVGLPGCEALPVVDPRGLIMPFWDGWSLDVIVRDVEGREFVPALHEDTVQQYVMAEDGLSIRTRSECDLGFVQSDVEVRSRRGRIVMAAKWSACWHGADAELLVSIRPFNPEGVALVESIESRDGRRMWINGIDAMRFREEPGRMILSEYTLGDALQAHHPPSPKNSVECRSGMASAAMVFPLRDGEPRLVHADVDLSRDPSIKSMIPNPDGPHRWKDALSGVTQLDCGNERDQLLYDAAVRSLILHTPGEAYPGPFTYKRFWYRDAVLMLNAMLGLNMPDRAAQVLAGFPERQERSGYFCSQDGEWDSNGQVLWIVERFRRFTGRDPWPGWEDSMRRAADWILAKRCSEPRGALHEGLLPAGFSAEHLGNNDYYYWDDYWAVAGLDAAGRMLRTSHPADAKRFARGADQMRRAIRRSLDRSRSNRRHPGIPASPYRRMDSGAVGSIVAGYPLQLLPETDPELVATAEYLFESCFVHGGFFQEMIHSGINAYLSIHVAQVFLRAGDPRFAGIVQSVGRLASRTGQWPEAIHPRTHMGCMGDGHHAWASAEWAMMIRNMFVREEGRNLVLGGGVTGDLFAAESSVRFGPAATEFGTIGLTITKSEAGYRLDYSAGWTEPPALLAAAVPGCGRVKVPPADQGVIEVVSSRD